MIGRTILHYQLVEKIGSGGMGEIYKAFDPRLNRFVAIKVLAASMAASPESRRRFVQEAQAASALNHPNIVTIYDILTQDDSQYIVMEFLSGKTLVELIPKEGLRIPIVLKYGIQIADALSTAHAAGIVHRDLKPANIMVTQSGAVKLLDFGLAKLGDPVGSQTDSMAVTAAALTIEGSLMGTVNYMSPEQAEGKKLDSRSDIFSFGSVMYEMVTGRSAFAGSSMLATLSSVLRDDVRPMSQVVTDVPPELQNIISGCLQKDMDKRWPSMQVVHSALTALRAEFDSKAFHNSQLASLPPVAIVPPPPPPPPPKSRSAVTALVTAALLIAAGAGIWWFLNHDRSAQPGAGLPAAAPPSPSASAANPVLTNDDVLNMWTAKVPASLIISHIRSSEKQFNLSSAEIIRLTKSGVPADVIEAMRNPAKPSPVGGTPAVGGVPAPAAPELPPVPDASKTSTSGAPVTVIGNTVTVADGLPLQMVLADNVPAAAQPGQPLQFTVLNEVRINDSVVVPKGAVVLGEVSEPGKKILGLGGKMTYRLMDVAAVGGQKLQMRAVATQKGEGPARRPLNPSGKGKTKEFAAVAGTEYIGYIDHQQTISLGK